VGHQFGVIRSGAILKAAVVDHHRFISYGSCVMDAEDARVQRHALPRPHGMHMFHTVYWVVSVRQARL
jgi:hypothetical protein